VNTPNIDALRDSLHRQLNAYAASAGDRPNAKLHWLSEQLENYIERWLGFLPFTPRRLQSQPDDLLFIVIELATEMLTVEIQQLPVSTPAAQHWQRFLRVLQNIRAGSNPREAADLRSALHDVRAALPVS
jgi:hypothetical protein